MRLSLTKKTRAQIWTQQIRVVILILTPAIYLMFDVPSILIYLLLASFVILLTYEYLTRKQELTGELILERNQIEVLLFEHQSEVWKVTECDDLYIGLVSFRGRLPTFRSVVPEDGRANDIEFVANGKKHKFHFTVSNKDEYRAVSSYLKRISQTHPNLKLVFGHVT